MSRRPLVFGVLVLAILMLSVASLSAGKVWVPWSVWLEEAAGRSTDPRWAIIFELRLPRTSQPAYTPSNGTAAPCRAGMLAVG